MDHTALFKLEKSDKAEMMHLLKFFYMVVAAGVPSF